MGAISSGRNGAIVLVGGIGLAVGGLAGAGIVVESGAGGTVGEVGSGLAVGRGEGVEL
jgi:hypothetical protein